MTNEIERTFEEYWEKENLRLDLHAETGQRDLAVPAELDRDIAVRAYIAGAEAKGKAERARLLEEVTEHVRALKNGWTTDEAWGRAVIDTCELLEHRLKAEE